MSENSQFKKSHLHHAEKMFRLLVESVRDYSIFMLDTNGFVSTWNSGAERIAGYTSDEIIGRHCSIFYPTAAIEQNHPQFELETAKHNGQCEKEGLRVRKDGSTYWAYVTITPVLDEHNKLLGFAKVIQDITERRLQEQSLRESGERLRLLVESVRDYAIFSLDQNGYIISWNSGAERIKGYKENEIIGKHFSLFYPKALVEAHHPQKELELAKKNGRYEEEGIRIRKDGTEFHAHVVITALYDSAQRLRGFAKVTRDITERKRAEDRLKQANEYLERRVIERTKELQTAKEAAESANKAKTAFLANMSHEIRTPLGAVIGFSEMLAQSTPSASEAQEYREAIEKNGELLVSIINDVLDLSKIEAGHLKIEKSEIQLCDLVSQIAIIANKQAQEKGLEFTVVSEGDIPHTIETDPMRLKQILLNIIGNAIKFTSEGRVAVLIKEDSTPNQKNLKFIVEDTGPGIEEGVIKNLFQPFSQVDASITRKFGGTGLGLVLSRRLAQALGGNVVLARSEPGRGSVFTITISTGIKRTVLFNSHVQKSRPSAPTPPSIRTSILSGIKILLVEDVYYNRVLIRSYLERAGAEVTCAENGQEGLTKGKQGAFDIVLMDLSMPVMDGFTATEKLRKSGFKKPIVALTAHALNEEREQCLKAGFDDHFTKPVNLQQLAQDLFQIIRTNKQAT